MMTKKHVTQMALNSYPEPDEDQQIAKVIDVRGTNIVQVEFPDEEEPILCLMPAKFKKTIWVKRGGFVIIEPFRELFAKERYEKIKLRGRVAHILQPHQIKHLKKIDKWPESFLNIEDTQTNEPEDYFGASSDEEDLDPYFDGNPNHQDVTSSSSDEEWEY